MIPRSERLANRRKMRTERLQLALENRGWSKWRFQRELEARGVPGASRASVDRYLNGLVDKPSVDFYVEAAQLLDVTLLWLLGRSEAATEEDLFEEGAARRKAMTKYWKGFEGELKKGFPGYEYLSDHTRLVVRSAWFAYDHYLGMSEDPPQHNYAGVQEIGAAILAPLRALSIDPTELSRWQLDRYVTSVCQGIAFLNLKYGLIHPKVIS